MKWLSLFLLTSSLSVSAFAGTQLTKLECVGSNGATIESTKAGREGLHVKSYLALMSKKFVANLVYDEQEQKNYIELADKKKFVSYLLDLSVDTESLDKQTLYGFIIRTGDGLSAPMVLATTRCQLQLKN